MHKKMLLILLIFSNHLAHTSLQGKRKFEVSVLDVDRVSPQVSMISEPDPLRRQRSRRFIALEHAVISESEDEFIKNCIKLEEFKTKDFDALVKNDIEMDGDGNLKPGEIAFNSIIDAYRVYALQKGWSAEYIPAYLSENYEQETFNKENLYLALDSQQESSLFDSKESSLLDSEEEYEFRRVASPGEDSDS